MNKIILYIFLTIIGSILIIYMLSSKRQNESKNAFNRKIIAYSFKLERAMELPDETFAFAGRLDSNMKLNKYSDLFNLYETNYTIRTLDTIHLRYPSSFYIKGTNIFKDVLQPYFYCTNLFGDILRSDRKVTSYFKFNGAIFDYFKAISPNKIVVRSRYKDRGEINLSLSKLNLLLKVKKDNEYRLPHKVNGVFTNDGRLVYDNVNSKILYMYYYRGEILCLDTNLNFLYLSKTIDTVRTATIKTALIDEKGKQGRITNQRLIQAEPPKLVNIFVTTNENNLYVISRLKADNESESDFSTKQIIDVYDINNGNYKNSFYIPKYNNKKLLQFQIRGNTLAAIFGTSLVLYNINEKIN